MAHQLALSLLGTFDVQLNGSRSIALSMTKYAHCWHTWLSNLRYRTGGMR